MSTTPSIEILVYDITELEVDAIVNPTNSRLLPGSGIPGQIFRKGGSKIQIQCNKIINKIQKLPIGSAVITTGGALKTFNVIHTAIPFKGLGNEEQKLKLCILNSLKVLIKKNLKSIAFPLLSVGTHGFKIKEFVEIMVKAIKEFLETKGGIDKIIFCLENEKDYQEFERAIMNFKF